MPSSAEKAQLISFKKDIKIEIFLFRKGVRTFGGVKSVIKFCDVIKLNSYSNTGGDKKIYSLGPGFSIVYIICISSGRVWNNNKRFLT